MHDLAPPREALVAAVAAVADVWLAAIDAMPEGWLAAHAHLLSADETARCRRFVRDRDRSLYAIAHMQLRLTLSRHVPIPPSAWAFRTDQHGRLYVVSPPAPGPVHFSLSHTPGLVAIAVSGCSEIGVDVEAHTTLNPRELGRVVCSPDEYARLAARPDHAAGPDLLRLWTLKEAYVKARGRGLALDVRQAAFDLDGAQVAARFDPRLADDPQAWRFESSRPTPRHEMAVAMRVGRGQSATIRVHRIGWNTSDE